MGGPVIANEPPADGPGRGVIAASEQDVEVLVATSRRACGLTRHPRSRPPKGSDRSWTPAPSPTTRRNRQVLPERPVLRDAVGRAPNCTRSAHTSDAAYPVRAPVVSSVRAGSVYNLIGEYVSGRRRGHGSIRHLGRRDGRVQVDTANGQGPAPGRLSGRYRRRTVAMPEAADDRDDRDDLESPARRAAATGRRLVAPGPGPILPRIRLAYFELLDAQWDLGVLPVDPDELRRPVRDLSRSGRRGHQRARAQLEGVPHERHRSADPRHRARRHPGHGDARLAERLRRPADGAADRCGRRLHPIVGGHGSEPSGLADSVGRLR